jgi:hypothetical protein
MSSNTLRERYEAFYTEFIPNDRDDLIKNFIESLIIFGLLTIFNSGCSSGKSNILYIIAKKLPEPIICILTLNNTLNEQMIMSFEEKNDPDLLLFDFSNIKHFDFIIPNNKKVVIFISNINRKDGEFNKKAQEFIIFLKKCNKKNKKPFVMIDEAHENLTILTGGMNPKIDKNNTYYDSNYKFLKDNLKKSLNIFDYFRKFDIRVFICSATLHNVICSKLPSLGYQYKDIHIINIYPIQSLYSGIVIKLLETIDLSNEENIRIKKDEIIEILRPIFVSFEEHYNKDNNEKCCITFSKNECLENFKKIYKMIFGKDIDAFILTSREKYKGDYKEKMKKCPYILAINKINIGFDLKTITGQRITYNIIFREYSERVSQPISGNPLNYNFICISQNMIQTVCRSREEGKVYISSSTIRNNNHSDVIDLFEIKVKIFDAIKNGRNDCYRIIGNNIATCQLGRLLQCIQINRQQNIRI